MFRNSTESDEMILLEVKTSIPVRIGNSAISTFSWGLLLHHNSSIKTLLEYTFLGLLWAVELPWQGLTSVRTISR